GTVEIVMFPRRWTLVKVYVRRHKESQQEEHTPSIDDGSHHAVEAGDILVVMGKLDRSREEAQIICENIDFEPLAMSPQEAAEIYAAQTPVAAWMQEVYAAEGSTSEYEPPAFFDY